MNFLALADDVTGALEVGAILQTPVFLDADAEPVDGCVIDTETRHLGPREAAAKLLSCIHNRHPGLIYKKTDSTLRGNIGSELAALADAYPERQLVFLPAYPALGRIVVQGELLVHGVPVHLSDFASDPLDPVTNSRIAALFHPDVQVSIVDASTDEEMAGAIDAALQIRPFPILAGPASVARRIAHHLGLDSSPQAELHLSPRCLIVNGSLHPVAKEQVRRIRPDGGWVVMDLQSAQAASRGAEQKKNSADLAATRESVVREFLNSAQAASRGAEQKKNSADLAATRESVVREFLNSAQAAGRGAEQKKNSADLAATGESVVRGLPESSAETAQAFARALARAVREKLEHEPFDTLIVVGGDSAFALLESLNARVIHPVGEVAAGVPVSRLGPWQLVTKAGGFGDVDLLARLQLAATRCDL